MCLLKYFWEALRGPSELAVFLSPSSLHATMAKSLEDQNCALLMSPSTLASVRGHHSQHSLHTYLLSTYYVPGTVLDAGNWRVRKIEYNSSPCGTYSLVGEKEGFHGGSDGEESAYNVGSLRWKDSLEEGMATLSSIFARNIPMDRGAWQSAVHGVVKSWTWPSN